MIDWALFWAMLVVQLLDVLTTNRILAGGGRELNPVMRLFMRLGGRWWWVPKLAVAIIASLVLAVDESELATWLLGGILFCYVVVVVSNLYQIRRIVRRGR